MFDFLKSKKVKVFSPFNGEIKTLAETGDKVFADGLVGRGIAIEPTDGKLYAPFNGELSQINKTKHAYVFISDTGLELLVHCGIDTVELGGEGFKVYKEAGQKVSKGDLIAQVDLAYLRSKNKATITPIIVTNHENYDDFKITSGMASAISTVIIALKRR